MGTYTLTENDDNLGFDPFRYPSDDPGPYVINALGGNDNIVGGNLGDTINGGEGHDSLAGAAGANLVHGNNGDDYLQIYNEGGEGPNYDLLADSVFGDAGNDAIQFILGGASVAHKADGGAGIDRLQISFETRYDAQNQPILYSKVIDLRALWTGGWGRIDTGFVRNMEWVNGISCGQGNDRVIMGNYVAPINPATGREYDAPLIDGNGGDDYLSGGASADQINGGAGSDTILGNDGDDYLSAGAFFSSFGNDLMRGGNGNDILIGNGGNDRLYGDAGDDSIQAQNGNDTLYGGAGKDFLAGEEGDDTIFGGADNDQIHGGGGTNRLNGDAGDDSLFGGASVDTAKGGDGNDFINTAEGNDFLYGGAGDDTLGGSAGSDRLYGDAGADTLQGGNGADKSYGGAGTDTLDETVQDDGANDHLYGEADNDTLRGGSGNDWLFGGTGADTLAGGAGRDSFWFTTAPDGDAITDFNRTEGDRILLSKSAFTALATKGKLAANAFHSGAGVDAAHDATDRILYNTTTGELRYDADGTGSAAAQLIATLGDANHPRLSYVDILIVA